MDGGTNRSLRGSGLDCGSCIAWVRSTLIHVHGLQNRLVHILGKKDRSFLPSYSVLYISFEGSFFLLSFSKPRYRLSALRRWLRNSSVPGAVSSHLTIDLACYISNQYDYIIS